MRALAALVLVLAVPAAAQPSAETASVLRDTAAWEMTGEEGRRYRIQAAWPTAPAPPQGYPVFYVLDADWMFATVVDTVRALERRPGGSPAVVIGIGYPQGSDVNRERARDLTPRLGSPEPKQSGTGGAEAFLRFVETALKPEVARRYRIDSARETLFGHSFGGLFTLYALVNRPTLFDNWAAASPSIWFEDGLMQRANLRKRLAAKLAATGATARVLITVGEYEQAADPDFPPPRLDILMSRKQVDNAREFAGFLEQPGVAVRFDLLAGEDHGTVIAPAISRAVRWGLGASTPPAPAPRPEPFVNRTGVPIPDAVSYLKMTAEERYRLRLRSRKLPDAQHKLWVAEFDRTLGAGLTYGEHRRLAEEREAMDAKHGTKPRD